MAPALLWLQLGGSAAVILVASSYLAKSADIIAFKTGLGRAFVGVILLATATSLPELGTGVSSVALVGAPDLAAGDAFGSNLFNLMIIGLLDIIWRDGPILKSVGSTSVLVAALGIAAISLAAVALLIHGSTTALSSWYISPISVVMLLLFLGAMYMIYRAEQHPEPVDDQEQDAGHSGNETHEYASSSLSRAILTYAVAALFVVGTAIWLAEIGDRIATEMEWEASFVGTQFLAFSTSLPELATSFAAIRLGAPELAITNVLGSNIFNMGFVLFSDDLAYTEGVLWANVSEIHLVTAVIAILMTCVVIVALITGLRERPSRFWTVEAAMLIGLYGAASLLVFKLG